MVVAHGECFRSKIAFRRTGGGFGLILGDGFLLARIKIVERHNRIVIVKIKFSLGPSFRLFIWPFPAHTFEIRIKRTVAEIHRS